MTDIKIMPVPLEFAASVWPHALPHLEKGLTAATNCTLDELHADVMSGEAQLWAIFADMEMVAAFIAADREDDGQPFLALYALGGSGLHDWAEALDRKLVRHARMLGIPKIKFAGRRAWSKVMPLCRVTGSMEGDAVFERRVL